MADSNPDPRMMSLDRPTKRLGTAMRVLLVDDSAGVRVALGRLLTDAGADVTTARSGDEGLRYLLERPYDVLLTDLQMPGMDGFGLLQHARNLPLDRRPARMIAISGAYDGASLLNGSRLNGDWGSGPVTFHAKPVDLDALLHSIEGRPN